MSNGCCYLASDEIEKELDIDDTRTVSLLQDTKIQFSWDGKYMAVYSRSLPTTLWIWDVSTMKLTAVLSQRMTIEGNYKI